MPPLLIVLVHLCVFIFFFFFFVLLLFGYTGAGGSSQGIRPPSRQVLENEPPNQPLPAGEKENKQASGGVVR